jgi:hypothetical protein
MDMVLCASPASSEAGHLPKTHVANCEAANYSFLDCTSDLLLGMSCLLGAGMELFMHEGDCCGVQRQTAAGILQVESSSMLCGHGNANAIAQTMLREAMGYFARGCPASRCSREEYDLCSYTPAQQACPMTKTCTPPTQHDHPALHLGTCWNALGHWTIT